MQLIFWLPHESFRMISHYHSVETLTFNLKKNYFYPTMNPWQTNSSGNFQLGDKMLDSETGNYYYGARYYTCPERSRRNPKWSLWLSVDPLAENYPGWSPYNYTLYNPVRFVDPWGMAVADLPIEAGKTKGDVFYDRDNSEVYTWNGKDTWIGSRGNRVNVLDPLLIDEEENSLLAAAHDFSGIYIDGIGSTNMGVITGSGASSRIGYDELTGFGSEAGSSRLGKLLQSVALFFQALMPGGDNTMTTTVVKPERTNQLPAEKKATQDKISVPVVKTRKYPSSAIKTWMGDTLVPPKKTTKIKELNNYRRSREYRDSIWGR